MSSDSALRAFRAGRDRGQAFAPEFRGAELLRDPNGAVNCLVHAVPAKTGRSHTDACQYGAGSVQHRAPHRDLRADRGGLTSTQVSYVFGVNAYPAIKLLR